MVLVFVAEVRDTGMGVNTGWMYALIGIDERRGVNVEQLAKVS